MNSPRRRRQWLMPLDDNGNGCSRNMANNICNIGNIFNNGNTKAQPKVVISVVSRLSLPDELRIK